VDAGRAAALMKDLPLLEGEVVGVRSSDTLVADVTDSLAKMSKCIPAFVTSLSKHVPLPHPDTRCIPGVITTHRNPPVRMVAAKATVTIRALETKAAKKTNATNCPHYVVYMNSQLGSDPFQIARSDNLDSKERLLLSSILRRSCWDERKEGRDTATANISSNYTRIHVVDGTALFCVPTKTPAPRSPTHVAALSLSLRDDDPALYALSFVAADGTRFTTSNATVLAGAEGGEHQRDLLDLTVAVAAPGLAAEGGGTDARSPGDAEHSLLWTGDDGTKRTWHPAFPTAHEAAGLFGFDWVSKPPPPGVTQSNPKRPAADLGRKKVGCNPQLKNARGLSLLGAMIDGHAKLLAWRRRPIPTVLTENSVGNPSVLYDPVLAAEANSGATAFYLNRQEAFVRVLPGGRQILVKSHRLGKHYPQNSGPTHPDPVNLRAQCLQAAVVAEELAARTALPEFERMIAADTLEVDAFEQLVAAAFVDCGGGGGDGGGGTGGIIQWEVDAKDGGAKQPHRSDRLQLSDALIDFGRLQFQERSTQKRGGLEDGFGNSPTGRGPEDELPRDQSGTYAETKHQKSSSYVPAFLRNEAVWEDNGWYEVCTPLPVREDVVDALLARVVRPLIKEIGTNNSRRKNLLLYVLHALAGRVSGPKWAAVRAEADQGLTKLGYILDGYWKTRVDKLKRLQYNFNGTIDVGNGDGATVQKSGAPDTVDVVAAGRVSNGSGVELDMRRVGWSESTTTQKRVHGDARLGYLPSALHYIPSITLLAS
jgi:hypothetical protein